MDHTLQRYLMAISVQIGAAIWIRRAWAATVPLAFGACAGPIEPMDKGKHSYQSVDKGGETTEIAALRQSLADLEKKLKERAEWEGDAWDSFKQNLDQFLEEWEKKGVYRDSLGDAAAAPKGMVEAGSYLAVTSALAMLALAVFMRATWAAGPVGVVAGETAASTVGPQIGRISTGALKKLTIVGFALMGIYSVASTLSQKQAAKFQDMKAMPSFDGLALQYDKNSGGLTPKILGNKNMPGGMGLPDSFPV
ncbi:hypothetical protein [Nonomuraea dietziae]|uniref:Uncharacterized protein n=3 Tax=Nonomuraea dietziae TaxID=65515 RepID=A0A7W5VB83_9ACTN|nr:hypothetical protein [Nonomuraea dietziae]MBB3728419.1 hypothetical protein [Nonomuraea dietziae]